jgi:hypothetical protein
MWRDQRVMAEIERARLNGDAKQYHSLCVEAGADPVDGDLFEIGEAETYSLNPSPESANQTDSLVIPRGCALDSYRRFYHHVCDQKLSHPSFEFPTRKINLLMEYFPENFSRSSLAGLDEVRIGNLFSDVLRYACERVKKGK